MADTRPVNHSAEARRMTRGQKTFWISSSFKLLQIIVSEAVACSRTTVSSDDARVSKRGRKAHLSGRRAQIEPSSSAIAKSTSSSCSAIKANRKIQTRDYYLKYYWLIFVNILTLKIRDELLNGFWGTNWHNNSLEAMDCIDLQMNLFSWHLLFEKSQCVNWSGFNHGVLNVYVLLFFCFIISSNNTGSLYIEN